MLRYEEAVKVLHMNHVRDAFTAIAMSDCDHRCSNCSGKIIDVPTMCLRTVAIVMEEYYVREDRKNDTIL